MAWSGLKPKLGRPSVYPCFCKIGECQEILINSNYAHRHRKKHLKEDEAFMKLFDDLPNAPVTAVKKTKKKKTQVVEVNSNNEELKKVVERYRKKANAIKKKRGRRADGDVYFLKLFDELSNLCGEEECAKIRADEDEVEEVDYFEDDDDDDDDGDEGVRAVMEGVERLIVRN